VKVRFPHPIAAIIGLFESRGGTSGDVKPIEREKANETPRGFKRKGKLPIVEKKKTTKKKKGEKLERNSPGQVKGGSRGSRKRRQPPVEKEQSIP